MAPFTPADAEPARSLYQAVADGPARLVLDYLIDHPDQQATAAEIQAAVGFAEHRHVAQSTYHIGQVAAAQGRRRPWSEGQSGYVMTAPIAALFATARAG